MLNCPQRESYLYESLLAMDIITVDNVYQWQYPWLFLTVKHTKYNSLHVQIVKHNKSISDESCVALLLHNYMQKYYDNKSETDKIMQVQYDWCPRSTNLTFLSISASMHFCSWIRFVYCLDAKICFSLSVTNLPQTENKHQNLQQNAKWFECFEWKGTSVMQNFNTQTSG